MSQMETTECPPFRLDADTHEPRFDMQQGRDY